MFDISCALRIQNAVKEVKLFIVRDPLIGYEENGFWYGLIS